jgi:hypothetical protein
MNNEFVTYERALALKELGFDELCFGYFDSKSELAFNTNGNPISKDWVWFGNQCLPIDMTLAPLKQQVFRWFREKYSLLPNIWSGKINHIFYGYDILHIKKQKFVINNTDLGGGDCDYDTYEEAENACIDKLIELAKQQDNGK